MRVWNPHTEEILVLTAYLPENILHMFGTEYLWRVWSLTIFTICSWSPTIKPSKKSCFTELSRVPLQTGNRGHNLLDEVYNFDAQDVWSTHFFLYWWSSTI